MSKVDLLNKSSIVPDKQNYCCISFVVDPENKTLLTGIRVAGVFETVEKASEHASQLREIDPYHNVYVGEMGSWLPFNPDPLSKEAGDAEYAEEQLNEIMHRHVEEDKKAKIVHERIKNENLMKSVSDNINTSKNNREELVNSLDEAEAIDVDRIKERISRIDADIEKMENNVKDYQEKINNLNGRLEEFEGNKQTIDI